MLFIDLVELVESDDFIFVIREAGGARLGYKFLVFFGGLESLESLEEVVPAFFFLVQKGIVGFEALLKLDADEICRESGLPFGLGRLDGEVGGDDDFSRIV